MHVFKSTSYTTMKKLYIILSLIIISTGSLTAQNSFDFSPSNFHDSIHNLNSFGSHQIDIIKRTSDDLSLGWATVTKDWPQEWETTLCPYGACLTGIPDSGEMLTLTGTENAYMRITMNPYDHMYTASVEFNVWDMNNPSDSAHCSFLITADDFTSVVETASGKSISIYPNPASEYISIKNEEDFDDEIHIINSSGKMLSSHTLKANQLMRISINELSPGVYFINFKESPEIRKLIVQ